MERLLYTCDICGVAKYADEANQWRLVDATTIDLQKEELENDELHICPDCWGKLWIA